MDKLQFDEKEEATLRAQYREEMNIVENLRDKVNALTAELSNVQVNFADPTPGFDRSKVKGVVARLVKVKVRNVQFLHVAPPFWSWFTHHPTGLSVGYSFGGCRWSKALQFSCRHRDYFQGFVR